MTLFQRSLMTTIASSSTQTPDTNMDPVTQWIVAWFERHSASAPVDIDADFYATRMIDSFGIIELIDDVESHFSFMFHDEDFQLPHFREISGMVDIINQRRA